MICYISLKINWTFWGFGLLVLKVANVSALFFRKCYFRDHFLTTYTHIGLLKSGITDHQSIRNTGRSFICILGSPVAQLIFSVTAIYCMSTFIKKKKHSEVSKLLLFHSYVNSCIKCFFYLSANEWPENMGVMIESLFLWQHKRCSYTVTALFCSSCVAAACQHCSDSLMLPVSFVSWI